MKSWIAGVAMVAVIGAAALARAQAGETEQPAANAPPSTQPRVARFPSIEVDMAKREIRVECQSLNPQMPLEFFCVLNGTNEHESVLRSPARPMHVHTALLMLGLKPGHNVRYSEADKKWLPPTGDPVDISVETLRNGKLVREPATSWMRSVKTHEPCPAFQWVFAGSRVMPDGNYAADVTGYTVSVVNFDLTLIDTPHLASNANETLEWEFNPDKVPPKGTAVTMILSPGKKPAAEPASQPADIGKAEIAMPLLTVNGGGTLNLNDQRITLDQLEAKLRDMARDRPLRLRISIAPGGDLKILQQVKDAADAAGVRWDLVPAGIPSTTHD